jgi:nicotinate-nucleotide pyrophosphorylase (carboxylating)
MEKNKAYNRNFEAHRNRVRYQAKLALDDDIKTGDITTRAVVKNNKKIENAIIIAKDDGVLCGLQEAKAILEEGGLQFMATKMEGDLLKKKDIIATVRGNIGEILKRERTTLNYLQILSGIATATYKLARIHPKKVASLRKTHPGLCFSEKRAVKVGGGFTHRLGLYDGFLIKDNHLATIAKELFGDDPITEEKKVMTIIEALKRAKRYRANHRLTDLFIEIEIESIKQAIAAAKFYKNEGVPDMILLDNMKTQEVARCVKAIKKEAGEGVLIEASGGITAQNINDYVRSGVDIVSTSEITLSAKPLDISMKIIGYK